jgi:AsmA-like C-terminal region
MTDKDNSPHIAAFQELEAALDAHRRTQAEAGAVARADAPKREPRRAWFARRWGLRNPGWRLPFNPWFMFDRRHPVVRKATIVGGAVAAVALIFAGALWWRLGSGPIMLDLFTPWLTAAIEQNLGSRYRVEVGGTQLERDAQGRTALRLRDIVLRDLSGVTVAVAPKAEVGISGTSLLIATPRAESFRLVDANMTVRIDADGRINVMVGGERPFVTIAPEREAQSNQAQSTASVASQTAPSNSTPARQTPPIKPPQQESRVFSLQTMSERSVATNVTALLAWIDELGKGLNDGTGGFDGQALNEIGITNGSLTIDDRRGGTEWKLTQISLNLNRPKAGGLALTVLSESQERPWVVSAALTPAPQGHRRLQFEARKVVLDDLLALRMTESKLRSDTLLSASIDSDIAADGTPHTISGSVLAQGGSIGNPEEPEHQIPITSAEFGLDWDIARNTLRVPFKVTAGAARFTLRSEFAAPAQPGGNWIFALGGGWIVLDPISADDEGLVLKRVVMRGNIDTTQQRITLEHGDLGTKELGSTMGEGITVAMSGKLDYAGEPRLALGIACNPMPAAAFKRLWPAFISPKVRDWVVQHIVSGNVERLDIATNATFAQMQPGGPPMPEEGLSVEIVGSSTTLRPVAGLPSIRDADMTLRLNGRTAKITLGKGTVDVSPGRRLTVSNGLFEVPNTRGKSPPARVSFRVDGPVPAAAELLALERLREYSGAPFDPAGTRGTVTGLVQLGMPLRPDLPPGSTDYDITVDLVNFSADKMLFGQKVEAQTLRVSANNQLYEIKGDVKVAGAPAQIEYRKLKGDIDAEVKLTATLDEAGRTRVGLDVGPALAGPMPMKLTGRIGVDDKDGRFNVEADLTNTKIENLLPGWVKAPGRQARVAFTMVRQKSGGLRFDDVLIDGQGVLAKGTVELDADGDMQSANFPVFATSDGDKTSVRADRGADGALRVVMRGDVYDGRNIVKSVLGGPSDPRVKAKHPDVDLDIKLGVVAGHLGETIRGLDWRMSRRAGKVRTFSLNAKIGRDTPLVGEIRTRANNGKPVLYFETNDAGALFRFTDLYQRMVGGKMWVGMDPPTQDGSTQEGVINVSAFSIRGDSTLDRVVTNAPNNVQNSNIEFSQARADFTRAPGRMTVRDGVLRGPMIGATVEGNIDYARDQVAMRGTLVPLYGLNNMFGQIPIVGLFLGGGSNEGMFGITYEVSGTTSNPRPMVNPISAIAPGVLRKFFEFRETPDHDRAFAEPSIR